MWLSYVKQPAAAYSITTAIENLANHFDNLEFEAEHEAEYGFDRFHTYEECIEIARKYKKGSEACSLFFHTPDLRTFLRSMKELGLKKHLDEVKNFVPSVIFREVFK